ncbi:Transthyretin-like family protein [Teladorsagia circumcincta]|uniref:Transthyretin-like family protein n=1 Tax=Teladorsagia circumcincta TaxID=45464 RepID=A0A2G9U3H9_TELCI|nr:Transthyretin-like family protein [Teladorsagia circumcincta]
MTAGGQTTMIASEPIKNNVGRPDFVQQYHPTDLHQQQHYFNNGDPDDVLDQVLTESDGVFKLSGFASELTPIDPELRIYHDCNDHGKVELESESQRCPV